MDAAEGRVGSRAGVSLGGLVSTASAKPGGRGGEGDGAQDQRQLRTWTVTARDDSGDGGRDRAVGAGGQGTGKGFLKTEIPRRISLLVRTSQGRRDPPMKGRKRTS